MSQKRILYISYDGMTDPLGQSQVLPYLKGLGRKGYKITLLSCEKPERATQQPLISQICQESDIDWRPIPYTRKPPVLSTIKDVRHIRKVAESLHRQHPFDIVHCRSYISALIGQGMQRRHGIKFIFDMRGFWADERVDGGLWRLSNPLFKTVYRYFKKKEKAFLEGADAIVSLTHAAAAEIDTWPLSGHLPIDVIPCCVDTDLFVPEHFGSGEHLQLKQQLSIPDACCVLGYVGSLGTWYQLPEMLQFFKAWQAARPDSIMLFVTTEPREMIMQEAVAQAVDPAAIRIVSASRKEVPVYISMMDYGVFFLKQVFSKKASSPVKQGELMAMGIPVICNAGVGDSDRIVQQYSAGVLVYEYTEEGYRKAIGMLDTAPFDPAAIRAGSIDYFDLSKGIDSYARIYERLTA